MKEKPWTNVLEGIGVVAVVASLVFVGLQLRQAQEIAIAEGLLSLVSMRNELNNGVRADIDVWEKARSGDELTGSEMQVFAIRVNQINDLAYFSYMQSQEITGGEGEPIEMYDFAIFLHNNSAAKTVWLDRENYLVKSRGLIGSGDDGSFWRDMVLEEVSKLERNGVPSHEGHFLVW